ncbi:MAG: PilZ domain-containing protein [Myxococcota bacterium]
MEWDDIFGPDAERHRRPAASEALQTLQTAAETEPPVSFIAAHMSLSCPGRLRGATAEGIVVELPHPPEGMVQVGAMAAIRFPIAGRAAGFTSRVQDVRELDSGAVGLRLEIPEKIRTDEQRAAVRIPVPDATLAAAMLDGETPVPVRAIDISLSGMGVELKGDTLTDLTLEHRRMVVLKLGRDKVLVEVEIRRQDGRRFGLAFVLRDERPPALVKIVSKLQYLSTAT